ncbi:MAG TPA: 3-keto-5-aminohexanoate cleavage protein [Azospirillaceae bacterium]|nr:3-keto-5-aminohexanoate cleavage protein [Azospirillaceae bacterium]
MQSAGKVVITCAVTGSIHTPTMSPHLPVTPDEIVRDAVAAAQAGASILHLHARNPADGRPTPDADVFMDFLPRIKQQTDAVINITTGGAPGMSMEQRLQAPHRAQPEMTSLNMGTMNFGVFQLAEKYKDWKHAWEKPFLESTRSVYAVNSFEQIETIIRELGHRYGTRFEYECYDIGHLYTVAHFADRGLIEPPFFIQGIFGVLGGIGAELDHLVYMRQVADRLFGQDYLLSAFGIGRQQMRFLTLSAMLGGNVRVGLEDSLYIGRGKLARSNADQVVLIRRILEDLGYEIATPADARAMLGLKGGDKTAF